MEIAVQEKLGRCALASRSLVRGDVVLEERAALFWQAGPRELLDILQAYDDADVRQRARIDDLTSEIQTPSPALDSLVESWVEALESAVSQGQLTTERNIRTDLVPILLKTHFNAHAVQCPEGACLFPTAAMLNHSCAPNVFYQCQAHTIRFVANTELEEGSELTASYLDAMTMLKPTRYRQGTLLLSKGFLCACDRCASKSNDCTRALRCRAAGCGGTLYASNAGLDPQGRAIDCTWSCNSCAISVSSELSKELESIENDMYQRWQLLDDKLSRSVPISGKEIDGAIRVSCERLHPAHFVTQLFRILAIEMGVEKSSDSMRLISYAFQYADWLYTNFAAVPSNLLGTMTGALAELFDRKTFDIVQGLDIDRVLTIMKAVLPFAQLRYGAKAAYPRALDSVIQNYASCGSLICQKTGRLSRCGRCASISYCSRSCQVFHYKSQGHKEACLAIVRARERLDGFMV